MPASPATVADPKAKQSGPGPKKRAAKPADAAAKPMTVAEINELHADAQKCAEVAGLIYVAGEEPGMRRIRRGKGFSYLDHLQQPLTDAEVKARITQLAIPPAWQKVWICPNADGHILATGQDDKGRKQYIYHPRWRAIRDMLNFYRLILFSGHIRIGNEVYAEENDSYGLTTLTRKHVQVSGDQVSFAFPAKSGKPWDVTINDPGVARVVQRLLTQRGRRLFSLDGKAVSSDELNQLLFSLTGEHITAKNFRTWGGTLAAFTYLKNRLDSERSAEKVVIEAIDEAAEALGNTRTVARAHYVHPHVLETYTEQTFGSYLAQSKPRPIPGLHPDEQLLAAFLLELFEAEFSLLSTRS